MKLILIYQPADADKNFEYIELYKNECKRRGLDFSLIITGAPGCGVTDFNEHYGDLKVFPPDTVFINRSRDAALTRHLENAGFRVYNNSLIAELGNDKLKALRYVEEAGIPVMKSFSSPPSVYPYVMKTVDGHGGNEVFLIHNDEELSAASAALTGRQVLYQEFCDTPGRDKRVYIVGNKVTACMLRTSDNDFRSNYSLGGNAEISELTPDESDIIKKLLSRLSIGHAGIDLIYHKGRPVFNELEDVVGSRMLYRYTDIDVVKLFMDHICDNL
ncbi:MAG: ATP-grasp domain-containing protein [Lachnospiraceae bacterium]|nr:ATP-grasp domain-containing protein [Lachnospiraceae bacterium]